MIIFFYFIGNIKFHKLIISILTIILDAYFNGYLSNMNSLNGDNKFVKLYVNNEIGKNPLNVQPKLLTEISTYNNIMDMQSYSYEILEKLNKNELIDINTILITYYKYNIKNLERII